MKKNLHHVDPGSALLIIYLALMVLLVAGNVLTTNADGISDEVNSAPPEGLYFTSPPHFPAIPV